MNEITRDTIVELFKNYNEKNKKLYNGILPLIIIYCYVNIENDIDKIYKRYKKVYLENKCIDKSYDVYYKGLNAIYDYIMDFDYAKEKFDILLCSLIINNLLYSECDYKDKAGRLRMERVVLNDLDVEVPDANDARKFLQSHQGEVLPNVDLRNIMSLMEYLSACIYITTELIRNQPFIDGNKRTFQSLLNLMFKKYHLPPVYIKESELEEYKSLLVQAMKDKEYDKLIQFYLIKLCDSIYELDISYSKKK